MTRNEWLDSSWVCSRHSFAPQWEHTWPKPPTVHVFLISTVFFSSVLKSIHCYFCCQNGCSEVSHTLRFNFCFPQLKAANLSLISEELCCPTGHSVGHLMSSFTLQSNKRCLMTLTPEGGAMCWVHMNHCLHWHFNKLSCWMLWRISGILSVFYVPNETLTASVPYPVKWFLNSSVQRAGGKKTNKKIAFMTTFTD